MLYPYSMVAVCFCITVLRHEAVCYIDFFYFLFEPATFLYYFWKMESWKFVWTTTRRKPRAPWTKYLSKWVIPLTLAATVALAVSRCRQKYCQEGRMFSMMSWGRLYQVLGAIQIHRFTRNSLPKTHKMDGGGGRLRGTCGVGWSDFEKIISPLVM